MNRTNDLICRCSNLCRSYLLAGVAGMLLTACGGSGEGQDPDPLVEDFGIAFVARPVPMDEEGIPVQPDIREVTTFNAGADLFYRELASPSAPERNVTVAFTGGMGDVKDVEASYDGEKLLFAMRAPEIENADPEDQPKWNIWEYEIATDLLQRVIPSDITAEAGHDVAPYYLPDGRIIFSSTRQRQSKAILLDEGKPQFPALDEDTGEPAAVLHVMNADGSDIHQVSFNQSHDLDPVVLSSGEVVFSRWDGMGNRNTISLYKMHPDGTELEILYGAHSHDITNVDRRGLHFLQPRERADGRLSSIFTRLTDTYRGGDLVVIDTPNYIDEDQPTASNQGLMSGPGHVSAAVNVTNEIDTSTREVLPSPGGRYSSAYPLLGGTDRALVSWNLCRLMEYDIIVPCSPERLADPLAVEAPPLYGIFMYNLANKTQQPIVAPQEGMTYTDVVAAQPRDLPAVIFDKAPGIDLDPELVSEDAGILNIRSVYDIDGVDTAVPDIPTQADPAETTAADRPARFLRIIKAVGIPDDDVRDFRSSAFGASRAQQMREIVGYVPVQPDGSVRVKVPAYTPLAISVVDKSGQRIGGRHQSWLQLRAGETVNCSGCHDHSTGIPHGHPEAPPSVYAGAPVTGLPFPNTDPALFANFAETMAETLTRLDTTALLPTVDMVYRDVWTDETPPNGRPKDPDYSILYAGLNSPTPATGACQDSWNMTCRTIIHYEQHIHPLWKLNRGGDTCTNCHHTGDPQFTEHQLDLTDGPSSDVPDHFNAYRELVVRDILQERVNGILQDVMVPVIDPVTGLPLLDPVSGLPVMEPVFTPSPMSVAGARASSTFFSRFEPDGSHAGRLTAAELRLLAEWVDIGAQYYNDPFAAPLN
ncbi:MAG: hypothetical protein WBO06_02915 [Gammaproteobacteria bacterium]